MRAVFNLCLPSNLEDLEAIYSYYGCHQGKIIWTAHTPTRDKLQAK